MQTSSRILLNHLFGLCLILIAKPIAIAWKPNVTKQFKQNMIAFSTVSKPPPLLFLVTNPAWKRTGGLLISQFFEISLSLSIAAGRRLVSPIRELFTQNVCAFELLTKRHFVMLNGHRSSNRGIVSMHPWSPTIPILFGTHGGPCIRKTNPPSPQLWMVTPQNLP